MLVVRVHYWWKVECCQIASCWSICVHALWLITSDVSYDILVTHNNKILSNSVLHYDDRERWLPLLHYLRANALCLLFPNRLTCLRDIWNENHVSAILNLSVCYSCNESKLTHSVCIYMDTNMSLMICWYCILDNQGCLKYSMKIDSMLAL